MLEVDSAAREILAKLPLGHPDIRPIEGILKITEGWRDNKSPEINDEVRWFLHPTREILVKQGFDIYELSGKSIKDVARTTHVRSASHRDYSLISNQKHQPMEVAINPRQLFISTSSQSDLELQLRKINYYKDNLRRRVGETVDVIMGTAPQYVELVSQLIGLSLERGVQGDSDYKRILLMGRAQNYTHGYARTTTYLAGGSYATVGGFFGVEEVLLNEDKGDSLDSRIWAFPLVIPA